MRFLFSEWITRYPKSLGTAQATRPQAAHLHGQEPRRTPCKAMEPLVPAQVFDQSWEEPATR